MTRWFIRLIAATLAATSVTAVLEQTPATEMVPIQWLEPAADAPREGLPLYQPIPAADDRVPQALRMVDNEAARFIRKVIAGAWRMTAAHGKGLLPALPIVFQRGGNNARQGFRLADGSSITEHRDTPYVVLDFDADRLSLTLLHEGGHVVDRIVRSGKRDEVKWSGLPHSTFAVTDPVTALGEGFAIHFETLWGHYGSTPSQRAYYHRTEPVWNPTSPGGASELVAPLRDIMTFSQNWARYQSVRDGLTVFEGHVYAGDYLRSQYDPARDRARLRNGSALVASEGTVASVLFWIVQGRARAAGAVELNGLDQPSLLDSELQLVGALRRAAATRSSTIDIVDVVTSYGGDSAADRRHAVERFVAITKGATARSVRARWQGAYAAAIGLDLTRGRTILTELDTIRREVIEQALADPRTLRRMVGPTIPVRVARVKVSLKALGEPFPVEFDLNALGAAELEVLAPDPQIRSRIQMALDEKPLDSIEDFERRTHTTLSALGATRID